MIRVAIADDHRLLLEGLAQALAAVPDITVVATAQDGAALLEAVGAHEPDVVLVDLEMPGMGGEEVLRRLGGEPPAIVVTMHADERHRGLAERAGAVGFLSKAIPLPDLAAAVRAAVAGERLLGPEPLAEVLARHRTPQLDPGASALTERERELLGLLAAGHSSTEELAERMFISQKTVKNHLASIYEKLGITDRAQAVVEAIRLGLRSDEG